jgi:hypothetical protein
LSKAIGDTGLSSAKLDFTDPEILMTDMYAPAATAVAAAMEVAVVGAEAVSTASTVEDAKPFITYTRRVGISTRLATEMQVVRSLLPQYGCEEDYRAI